MTNLETSTQDMPVTKLLPSEGDRVPPLFRHVKRGDWGLGIVVGARGDRLDLQFQDGQQRTFKKGFYHLLDAVDRQLDVTLGIVDALETMASESDGTPKRKRTLPITMTEQIAYFRHLHPGGFVDDGYVAHHRGDGRKRPLIRHRDALVARAQEQLSKANLRRALASNDFGAVHRAAHEVIASTDLVSVKERKAFGAMDAAHHAAFADSVHALLHGTSPLVARIDGYTTTLERALGQAPSWPLVTILLGAVHPHDHVVVEERVFARQAEWSAPGASISSRPMGFVYERLRSMARGVRDALVAAGMKPRDLLDVTALMDITRKPKAQAFVETQRANATQEVPATEETRKAA